MLIREMNVGDYGRIGDLIEEFHKESLQYFGMKMEKEALERIMAECVDSSLVMEKDGKVVGIIAGKLVDNPLQKAKIFHECMWYVSKKFRKQGFKLLKKLEKMCKKRGYSHIIMIHLANEMGEKLSRIYKAMGYKPLESHYLKAV